MSHHELVIDFSSGDQTETRLVCNLTGSDRPCAIIECPVDHEDLTRDCIVEHGATTLDECWAVGWIDASDREALDTSALAEVRIPVRIVWDEGVVALPVVPTVAELTGIDPEREENEL